MNDDLLARYVSGNCTLAEQQRVRAWLDESPEHAAELVRWRAIWARSVALRTDAPPAPIDTETALARLRNELTSSLRGLEEAEAISVTRGQRLLRPQRRGLAMTGVAAFVALAFVIVHRGQTTSREYTTRPGQRASVTLSDGTRFTLAPASRLRVPVDYATGNRAVALEGEAFFVVMHDAAHPFSVRVRNAVATDIGTQFDVRAYASDRDVRVAVSEGRVGVGVDGSGGRGAGAGQARPLRRSAVARPYTNNNAVLAAGDMAVVIDTAVAITHDADVSAITSWTSGTLVFRDTPLPDVVAELSRWYGVTVRIGDAVLASRHVTATFDQGSLVTVLDVLAPGVGARYERHGSETYTLLANPNVQ